MKMRIIYLFVFLLVVGAATYWWSTTSFGLETQAPSAVTNVETTREETVIAGAIGSSETLFADLQILAEQLGAQLGDSNIRTSEAVMAQDVTEAAHLLRQGRADVFVGEALPIFVASELSESEVFLGMAVDGRARTSSTIFVTDEQTEWTPDALKGQVIAFTTETSTDFLLVKAELLSRGFVMEQTRGNPPTSLDVIGYYFAGGEDEVLAHVKSGIADAGVIPTHVFLESLSESDILLTPVLATAEIPSGLVVLRSGIDTSFKTSAKIALLQTSFEGQAFVEITPADIAALQKLTPFINLDILNLEE